MFGGRTKYHALGLTMLLLLSACGAVRGELVESGFDAPASNDVELAFIDETEVASPLAGWNTTRLSADAPSPMAFGFDAVDLHTGLVVPGEDLYAQRPLMISFLTPTCPICVVEAPKLAFAAEENPGVTYVVIHSGGDDADYLDFLTESGVDDSPLLHLVDGDVSLWSHFGVLQQPSYVFVDADGVVRSSIGALEDHGLERAAEEFLQTRS